MKYHRLVGLTFPSNHCIAVVSLIFEVAPKAKVHVMRVSTSEDSGWNPAHVTASLDHLLTLAVDAQKRVDIVSMSFGFPDDYGLEEKIDKLESLGTIFEAAAGNRGAYQRPYLHQLASVKLSLMAHLAKVEIYQISPPNHVIFKLLTLWLLAYHFIITIQRLLPLKLIP